MIEVEWVSGSRFGVTKVKGTHEWAVVRVQTTIFSWSDPRVIYSRKGEWGTEQILIVTTAPDRETAIGYCKLLKGE